MPQGVACFLSRLPSRDAQAALQQVQAAAQSVPGLPAAAGEAQYPWDLYHDFVQLLEDRVAKVPLGTGGEGGGCRGCLVDRSVCGCEGGRVAVD